MRFRGITLVEILIIGLICAILWAILWPVFNHPVSFTKTSMPPVSYQNVELHIVLTDLFRVVRKQRGESRNYAKHYKWENDDLKMRKVNIKTQDRFTLKEIFQRIENSAQIKFEYLERPYHPGDVGESIIRDTRQKQNK